MGFNSLFNISIYHADVSIWKSIISAIEDITITIYNREREKERERKKARRKDIKKERRKERKKEKKKERKIINI